MRLASPIGWFMEARLAAVHMHLSAVLGISSNGSCLPFSQPAMSLPRSLNRHGGHVKRQSSVLTPTWELLFSEATVKVVAARSIQMMLWRPTQCFPQMGL